MSEISIESMFMQEYLDFVATDKGRKWQESWKKYSCAETPGCFSDYMYDFHPEYLA